MKSMAAKYLFIDQNPFDKIVPSLVVKIVSEELCNLKQDKKSTNTTQTSVPGPLSVYKPFTTQHMSMIVIDK